MSKINVSELTETELNRAMIWLYPPSIEVFDDTGDEIYFYGVMGGLGYLKDYNLTIPLAVENRLLVDFKHSTVTNAEFTHFSNKPPLHAMCEVLVMIKLEEMGL